MSTPAQKAVTMPILILYLQWSATYVSSHIPRYPSVIRSAHVALIVSCTASLSNFCVTSHAQPVLPYADPQLWPICHVAFPFRGYADRRLLLMPLAFSTSACRQAYGPLRESCAGPHRLASHSFQGRHGFPHPIWGVCPSILP